MDKVWNGTAWVDRKMSPYSYTNPAGEVVGMGQLEYDAAKGVGTEGLAFKDATKNADVGMWDTIKNSFNPEGASGKSYAGNVMDTGGTIGSLGSIGLAAYYDRKNYKAQKAQQDRRNAITDKVIASGNQAATNAGNGASYSYQNVLGV